MKSQTILVVDDQPINLKLLQRKLEREGMTVVTAVNGQECLERVAEFHPDLILLDVMMPEMDGIEACQRLKADPSTASIPIIFITAKSSKEGKLEGLGVGAVDYITKPIDLEETTARVRTQLRFQEIYRENIELQKRLGESRRSAAVGAVTQGIAHNLNNLLGVVVGYLDLLKNGFDSPDMVKRSVGLIDQAIQRMVGIIRQLSTIATQEKVALSDLPLRELLQTSVDRFRSEYGYTTPIHIDNKLPEQFTIRGNAEVLESVLGRLLANAAESYGKEANSTTETIVIEAETQTVNQNERLLIRVNDTGSGIDDEVAETLFEPFVTTKTSVGRGLGLTIARHIIRNLHGDVTVQPRNGRGTYAVLMLPIIPR
jgi:two-component system sensor histidine kinase/response regulator